MADLERLIDQATDDITTMAAENGYLHLGQEEDRRDRINEIVRLVRSTLAHSALAARAGAAYDRDRLVEVLVYHQRTDTSGCHCGWAVLGASYAEHVADAYEMSARAAEGGL